MDVTYRQAEYFDIPEMARIRSISWGDEKYWTCRIAAYLNGELHPQHALPPRVGFVALHGKDVVGLIAGHLTRRYDCDGELEWIDVLPANRGTGIASKLLALLADWFVQHNAVRICVDVQPMNKTARSFYMRHGATELNKHFLVWNEIKAVPARSAI